MPLLILESGSMLSLKKAGIKAGIVLVKQKELVRRLAGIRNNVGGQGAVSGNMDEKEEKRDAERRPFFAGFKFTNGCGRNYGLCLRLSASALWLR